MFNMTENLRQKLIDECERMGVIFKDFVADGEWHRADLTGDRRGKDDASIKIFKDGQGGIIKNWKTGEQSLVFSGMDESKELKAVFGNKPDAENQNHEEIRSDDKECLRDVSERAKAILNACVQASQDHPYLMKKGIKAHGVLQYKECLVIPIRSGEDLLSLQFIDPDGSKRFLKGGRVSGGYFMIGEADK